MTPSRSQFVAVRRRRYHVRQWGDDGAPCLFMLHGWGDVGASFQFVVDELQGHWCVRAPDWRGFGLSQWNDGPYWFPDYLADLDALLEHYSADQPTRIVGHSLGGIVASVYAGVRPERVARFANLEGFAPWVAQPGETPDRFGTWLTQIRADDSSFRVYAQAADFAARMRRDNPRLTPERAEFLAQHATRPVDGGCTFAGDPHHRWINPVLYPLDEAKACWRRIRARTLCLSGGNSPMMQALKADPDEYRRRLACFADAREAVIDDCGHNLHHDQPAIVAGHLEAFFADD